jgi:hypothetical protein
MEYSILESRPALLSAVFFATVIGISDGDKMIVLNDGRQQIKSDREQKSLCIFP